MRYVPIECILTEEELKALVPVYQDILRLNDWIITVRLIRESAFSSPKCGDVEYWVNYKQALIQICEHGDYPKNAMTPNDMEQTLVHEIAHLLTVDWSPEKDTMGDHSMENATEAISMAVVQLRRELEAAKSTGK